MVRNRYDEQLALLNNNMIEMGSLCAEVISLAARALTEHEPGLLGKVRTMDGEIDQMERDIEKLCLNLMLRQQPIARDLRQISSALKMITDMERIGDQAADIAEIVPYLKGMDNHECDYIRLMAEAAVKMVEESVEAFVRRDVVMAQHVISCDDVVDDYFDRVKSDLIEQIKEQHVNGEYILDLLMVAKYFERIGDHATNIAEWVEYAVTGVHRSSESVGSEG